MRAQKCVLLPVLPEVPLNIERASCLESIACSYHNNQSGIHEQNRIETSLVFGFISLSGVLFTLFSSTCTCISALED